MKNEELNDIYTRLDYLERKSVEHDFQIDSFATYIDRIVELEKSESSLTHLKREIRRMCLNLEKGMDIIDLKLMDMQNEHNG